MDPRPTELSLECRRQTKGGAIQRNHPPAGDRALRSRRVCRGLRAANLSFHYVGDFWNDRVSCLIVASGVWRFYRDDYYKGPSWDLGPLYYESFFTEKGPDDVVSSFQAIALT